MEQFQLDEFTFRERSDGVGEVTFEIGQDISDKSVDILNAAIEAEFGPGLELDWRDPHTLWIHYPRS